MNLDAWERELSKVGLQHHYTHILDGFETGFSQGIPKHVVEGVRYYSPPNHRSALLARAEIEESFALEVKAGRMYNLFDPEQVWRKYGFFRTSPLGAVVNNDKSVRPINDLSFPHYKQGIPSVNSFVNKDNFKTTWDDFRVVADFIKNSTEELELGIFDWAKAYHQIPTMASQWRYLMI